MHPVLQNQLHQASAEQYALEHVELFQVISKTYEDFDAERKLMKRALEVSTEEVAQMLTLLKATINSVDEGILVFDKKGEVVNFNQRYIDIWQMPGETMLSKETAPKINFMAESVEDPAALKDMFSPSRIGHDKKTVSEIIRFKNGKVLDAYSTPQVMNGKMSGVIYIFRDITSHFRAEEDLRQKIDAMERLNKAMIDREIKMIELKSRIKELEAQLGTVDEKALPVVQETV